RIAPFCVDDTEMIAMFQNGDSTAPHAEVGVQIQAGWSNVRFTQYFDCVGAAARQNKQSAKNGCRTGQRSRHFAAKFLPNCSLTMETEWQTSHQTKKFRKPPRQSSIVQSAGRKLDSRWCAAIVER